MYWLCVPLLCIYRFIIISTVVSSLRQVPKPGYGLAPRSHTFSSATTTDGSAQTGAPVSASFDQFSFGFSSTFRFCFPHFL